MAQWICYNPGCVDEKGAPGKRFDGQKCSCGVDVKNPRHAPYIKKVETIHYDAPDPIIKGRGCNVAACDKKPVTGRMATGVPACVTCEKCKASPEFKQVTTGDGDVPQDGDFEIAK